MSKNIPDELLPDKGPGHDELLFLYQMSLADAALSGVISKWSIAQKLLATGRYSLRTNDKRAILLAFSFCCMRGFSIPKWCAKAYLSDCYHKVYADYESTSWDEVFGRPFPKGTQLAPKKEAREKRRAVYNRICELKSLDPKAPLMNNRQETGLFEHVGEEYGINRDKAAQFYYSCKKQDEASEKLLKWQQENKGLIKKNQAEAIAKFNKS